MDSLESLSYQLCRVMKEKAKYEEQEKELRKEILSTMVANRRKEESNEFLSIKYNPPSTRTYLKRDALEKKYPDAIEDESLWKKSKVNASITVKMNKGAMLV